MSPIAIDSSALTTNTFELLIDSAMLAAK